jgi:acetyl-CoA carboxylase biotin carboxyl carrier protein
MQLDHEQLHRLLEALGESDIQEFGWKETTSGSRFVRNLPGQTVMAPVMPAPVAAAAPAKPLDSASPPPACNINPK